MEPETAVRYQRMGESQSSEEDLPSTSGTQQTDQPDITNHEHKGRFDITQVNDRPTNDPTLPRNKHDIRKRIAVRRESESPQQREEMEMRPRNWYIGGTEEDDVFDDTKPVSSQYMNVKWPRNKYNVCKRMMENAEAEFPQQREEMKLGPEGGNIEGAEQGNTFVQTKSVSDVRIRENVPQNKAAIRMNRISSFSMPHQVSYHPHSKYQVSSDGQKMVLQLVLPQTGLEANKLEVPISPDYIQYDLFKPRKGYPTAFHSQPDFRRQEPDYQANRELGFSSSEIGIPDRSQLTVTSLGGVSGTVDEGDLPSTSPDEKLKMFRGYLSVILSCVYCVFIVTLGAVIYISDVVLQNASPLAESFSIYLVVLGLVYLIFLYADIRRYLSKVKKKNAYFIGKDDNSIKGSGITCHASEGNLHLSIPLPAKLAEDPLPHHYCFVTGRHSGSFYLKVGAAGFCFGHLIHSGLMLGYQIVYLTSEGEEFYNCASVATLILDVIYPIYSFIQLFFIFKYSNVIINRCKELARFSMMHCIASSICFWMWTIMRETLDSLSSYVYSKQEDDEGKSSTESHMLSNAMALPLTRNQQIAAQNLNQCMNNATFWIENHCKPPDSLIILTTQFSPYLYPFTIEYSILVVGILFIIWQNIGKCNKGHSSHSTCPATSVSDTHNNLVIHADCHSANKGLFAGIIVLVGSVISIIIFCIAMADNEFIEMGLTVNAVSELVLLLLMTITVILAYRKLTQLDINQHPISLLDDLLLFICIPAFFLYGIFSIVPAVLKNNVVSMIITILQVIQVLLQTPFIIDGLRRCSNTRMLRLKKPGRELVTFLVVCNVAMWITETFEIKSHEKRDDRYDVYGKVLWTMLSHMTVPLTMFYRFHSSVCLVDIWKSAYERGE